MGKVILNAPLVTQLSHSRAGSSYSWQLSKILDRPHKSTRVFSASFVLTRAHSCFYGDELPEKKTHFDSMGSLSTPLNLGLGCHTSTRVRFITQFLAVRDSMTANFWHTNWNISS